MKPALWLMFAFSFAAVAASAQEQPPRFQTTVDVTSLLDVTVVDGNGQPISGLGPGDFNVKIDGQERRVLSAEWVPVVENAKSIADSVTVPDGYSSNENTSGGRLIVIAIDQTNINFGGGTAMMRTMEAFIDKLLSTDRVAVVEFGPGAAPLTFVGDLDRVKQVVSRMTGNKQPGAPTTYNVLLTVTDSAGKTGSVTKAITINP